MPHSAPSSDVLRYVPIASDASDAPAANRWGWVELFAVMQLLYGALLFVPGAQQYRVVVRSAPYVASLAALLVFLVRRHPREPLSPSGKWLLASFALLAANLLHAETRLQAGLAQIVFQVSIAAPMFWAAAMVHDQRRLTRLLWIICGAGFLNAALGVLQVYEPDRFLPPEFSALGRSLNPAFVETLSYSGPGGAQIVRPPGLTDLPGGASVAGLLTVLIAVGYVSQERASWLVKVFGAAAAAVGMTALYLTQVRSLTIVAAVGVVIFGLIRLRQGRVWQTAMLIAGGAGLVAASFVWAASIGGKTVETRFLSIFESGLLVTFQENRGIFLDYTLRELLFKFPFGAGLGRWGMMQVYFPDPTMWHAPPIHVEIQITGWLLDGGFLMWVCYGGALLSAIRLAYRTAVGRSGETLQFLAAVILALQLAIVTLCLSGPTFNTQLGVLFWTLTGALYGVTRGCARAEPRGAGDWARLT